MPTLYPSEAILQKIYLDNMVVIAWAITIPYCPVRFQTPNVDNQNAVSANMFMQAEYEHIHQSAHSLLLEYKPVISQQW